jgi:hypothetical protein
MTEKTTGQAFGMLVTSRAFLVAGMDAVLAIATYFVKKYADPSTAQDVLFLFATLQPVFFAVIAKIAVDNRTESNERIQLAKLAAPCSDAAKEPNGGRS